MPSKVGVRVVEGDSSRIPLPSRTADLVLTDPPYHDDVHYGELSLPFRAWAGLSTDLMKEEAIANGSAVAAASSAFPTLIRRSICRKRK